MDTGRLRASIRSEVSSRALGVTGTLSTNVNYADFVHDGTSAHIIRPRRRGGVLRFQMGGRTVFARYVNHPGTRARPFLADALTQVAAARGWRTTGGNQLP